MCSQLNFNTLKNNRAIRHRFNQPNRLGKMPFLVGDLLRAYISGVIEFTGETEVGFADELRVLGVGDVEHAVD